jgi:hypothetical protein
MKAFRIDADALFYAESIDDAFRRVGEYYLALSKAADADDVQPLFDKGYVEIAPYIGIE